MFIYRYVQVPQRIIFPHFFSAVEMLHDSALYKFTINITLTLTLTQTIYDNELYSYDRNHTIFSYYLTTLILLLKCTFVSVFILDS